MCMLVTEKIFSNAIHILPVSRYMSPLHHNQNTHAHLVGTGNLASIAALHGGNLPRRYGRFQPYIPRAPYQRLTANGMVDLPLTLLNKIKDTQDAAVNVTSQKKDASQLCEFLSFCASLGIPPCKALPVGEDILLAWASSYAGRMA